MIASSRTDCKIVFERVMEAIILVCKSCFSGKPKLRRLRRFRRMIQGGFSRRTNIYPSTSRTLVGTESTTANVAFRGNDLVAWGVVRSRYPDEQVYGCLDASASLRSSN
jgi:hypothetical protein